MNDACSSPAEASNHPGPELNSLLGRLAALLAALEAERLRPLVVDINGLAKLLDCSRRHLERQRAAGELPDPVAVGNKLVWRVSDIELFVKANCDMARYRAALARR
ncbi:MAG: hypothetical protein C0467_17610 [Planctomycetaceae bacterium]|nr:hypothetical protein [Planctomycetaceae bacterium]